MGVAGRFFGRKIDINRFFKFCFVRNPWDRLVSNYVYLKSIDANYPYTEYAYPTFKDWILGTPKKRGTEKAVGTWVDSFRCSKCNSAIPLQLDMIRIKGKTMMDFIGRYERLQEDFDKVCGFINVKRQQLPRKNISYRKNYKEYFDEDTRKMVERQFSEDIEFFGYTF